MVDVIGFNYISRVYSMIKSVVAGLLTIGAILILQKRDFNAGKFGNEPNVSQSVDTVLMGDINNDRITDTAFVVGPKMKARQISMPAIASTVIVASPSCFRAGFRKSGSGRP